MTSLAVKNTSRTLTFKSVKRNDKRKEICILTLCSYPAQCTTVEKMQTLPWEMFYEREMHILFLLYSFNKPIRKFIK